MMEETETESTQQILGTCLKLSSQLRPYQSQPRISRPESTVYWQDQLTDENMDVGVDTEICATSDGRILWQRIGFRFLRPPKLEEGIYSKTHYPNCYVPIVWDRTDSRLSAALWLTTSHTKPLISQPLLMEIAVYGVKSLNPKILENLHKTTRGRLAEENNRLSENVFQILKTIITAVVKYSGMVEDLPPTVV